MTTTDAPCKYCRIDGVDWESARYSSQSFDISTGDVSAIDVNDKFIVVQFLVETAIDVYDSTTHGRFVLFDTTAT